MVPLLPAIERELLVLHAEAEDGAEFLFPRMRADSNLRQGLLRILSRAGVKPWPKLWQNLRASGATDFARSLPSHVAAEICGHTEQIAEEHYWQVSDTDLDEAISNMSPEIAEKLAQNLAHGSDSKGPGLSQAVSMGSGGGDAKSLEEGDLDAICRFLSHAGMAVEMGEAGLEPARALLPSGF
jgi:hypothetical protein